MKILILANSAWNLYNFRLELMHVLRKHHDVVAVAPTDPYALQLRKVGFSFYPVKLQNTGLHIGKDALFLLKLWRLYRRIKPDLALHYTIKPNIYGTLAASCLGIKSINNISGLGTTFLAAYPLRKFVLWLYRWILPMAAHNFFQNPDDMTLLQSHVKELHLRSSCIPGSGIDTRYFRPSSYRFAPNSSKDFTFLMMARLIVDKGVYEYAEATRYCRKWNNKKVRFLLLGEQEPSHMRGIPTSDVVEWHKEGIIEYLGVSGDVRPMISIADAVVLPSYREGMSRSLLEGAAMGKPLIATDVPGCREIVQDKHNGLLCAPKDAKSLALAMQEVLTMPTEVRKKWGNRSRTLAVRSFDKRFVLSAYVNKIHELVRK